MGSLLLKQRVSHGDPPETVRWCVGAPCRRVSPRGCLMPPGRQSPLSRPPGAEVDELRVEGAGLDELKIHPALLTRKEWNATADQHRVDHDLVLIDQIQRGRLGGQG